MVELVYSPQRGEKTKYNTKRKRNHTKRQTTIHLKPESYVCEKKVAPSPAEPGPEAELREVSANPRSAQPRSPVPG